MMKSVSFGEATILEFPMVLGDNPACSSGAPVQIAWEPVEVQTRAIDLYDYLREGQRRPRKELSIPVPHRAQILMQAGYQIDEIADALLKVEAVQKQRAESAKSSGLGDRFQIALEKTGKLPMGILRGALRMANPKKNTIQARSA